MGKVPFIDATGEAYLRNIVRNFKSQGGRLLVTGVQPSLKTLLNKSGLTNEIGEHNFFEHTGDAINCALGCVNRNSCIGCKHYAFRECEELSTTKIS